MGYSRVASLVYFRDQHLVDEKLRDISKGSDLGQFRRSDKK